MLPSAYGLEQYFQDLGHSFTPYGPPSRQKTYISPFSRILLGGLVKLRGTYNFSFFFFT